ncbi:Por secretion system C-terminal sorting domain-containing protein [Dyadobacter sp. SG02]|uniref:T9SS type A sorting domain-containing protein n=1 Tax=Dyadobacter sp. SG02 TaxID=1855291 RepID=UPI0008C4E4ED|nr:T9SS type A sorting domain-containing protein [Dyadobacter sp. SG02]SEJ53802.1 Por secretion system C-terminal sorting domain-containing protein [Dyadobacter sp. SG02]
MKRRLLLLAFALLLLRMPALAQTCGSLNNTITLSSQAQVNAFSTTYPGCTQVLGDIRVEGADIVDLNGLTNIQQIDRSLWIINNPLLTNMSGLSNLKSTMGFQLTNNPLLTNFAGLESLESAGITVSNCPAINSLSGLQNVKNLTSLHLTNTTIADFKPLTSLEKLGYVSLSAPNPNIKNFDGLQGLTELGGFLVAQGMHIDDFKGLDNVTKLGAADFWGTFGSLQGLNKVDTISSWLVFFPNTNVPNLKGFDSLKFVDMLIISGPSFTSLEGLESLTTALSYIRVVDTQITSFKGLGNLENLYLEATGNAALVSLEGFENVHFSNLILAGSPLLTQCAVPSVCMAIHDKALAIGNNGTGCNSVEEVRETPLCQEILPVTLLSFRGLRTPEGNKLIWETTSETNNKGFEIQRSHNARQFETIGFVTGSEDGKSLRTYAFTDRAPASPITYYRLKQLDHDGQFEYSSLIAIKEGHLASTIYPNPVRGRLNVKTPNTAQPFNLKDQTGLTVMESSVLPANGIDTSHLQSGLYFLSVGEEVFKVVVQD